MTPRTRSLATLALFVAASLGGGIAVGFSSPPDSWYEALRKPAFNPPNWVFGPVWTILYIMIAVAGWRVFERGFRRPSTWWVAQMALNFAWTPVFFTAHRLDWALAVILALLLAVLGFTGSAWRHDRPAAWLFVPYALWVGFATLLTASIWWLNGAPAGGGG